MCVCACVCRCVCVGVCMDVVGVSEYACVCTTELIITELW